VLNLIWSPAPIFVVWVALIVADKYEAVEPVLFLLSALIKQLLPSLWIQMESFWLYKYIGCVLPFNVWVPKGIILTMLFELSVFVTYNNCPDLPIAEGNVTIILLAVQSHLQL
jgi:hypothetical protein